MVQVPPEKGFNPPKPPQNTFLGGVGGPLGEQQEPMADFSGDLPSAECQEMSLPGWLGDLTGFVFFLVICLQVFLWPKTYKDILFTGFYWFFPGLQVFF